MTHPHRRPDFACGLLGFAAGGFFDGIVLHQVLQWHHLLSDLGDPALDLRLQVLADGLFHAAMYLIAIAGLCLLARTWSDGAPPPSPRRLAGNALLGFGAWHAADAVLSHWLLGIHRIRMDALNPLAWDLGWLLLFGGVPAAVGLWLRRGAGAGADGVPPRAGGAGTEASFLLALAVVAAGAVAARPPAAGTDEGAATVAVVLRPGVAPQRLLAALAPGDSRIVWSDAAGAVWLLRLDERLPRAELFRRGGALYVSGVWGPGGCAAWLRSGSPGG